MNRFRQAFTDLGRLPRAFWFVIGAFAVESMAYFGILTLMTVYLSGDLGWPDTAAGITVSLFTMLVTLFMIGIGSYAEKFGLRRAIFFALLISVLGRAAYGYAAVVPGAMNSILMVFGSVIVVAIGSAILQPLCYSGIKQYTDEKTNAMGYGLIYALMNLSIVAAGGISSWIRPGVDRIKFHGGQPPGWLDGVLRPLAERTGSGVEAVNWVFVGVTALTLMGFALLMTNKAESAKIRPDIAQDRSAAEKLGIRATFRSYFVGGPFANGRFLFFIFMLLPVRTLFAHQWLTMPQYILRAYPKSVGDHMEILVEWTNAGIICLGVPIVTAMTKHVHVYKMMMIGTLVTAAPTFLLTLGPDLGLLIAYLVTYSIGEAMWSARFLEYASEIAPPGRVAQYMGLASVPWLMAKGTTGFYSGWMLSRFCPDGGSPVEMQTGTMWLIYGCIAMTTPIGLWLARRWVTSGLQSATADSPRLPEAP